MHLMEHGFWDYVCPGAGGMEAFQKDDYDLLLDDMAGAGMTSLVIAVKWRTTGYRSRLSFLDQAPGNPVIASDNFLLRYVMDEASKRQIKVWLLAVITNFDVNKYGGEPYLIYDTLEFSGCDPIRVGFYDTDSPELAGRSAMIFEELVELFPGVRGFIVELEDSGLGLPHRISRYNKWADEKGRPPFEELGHPFNPRVFDVPHWRDYTTACRLQVLKVIQNAVRTKGWQGDLGMICETDRKPYAVGQEVNLQEFHRQFPDWIAITYEYNKLDHRYAMMDFCIEQPKKDGLKVFYLPRGVMTWNWPSFGRPLENNWQMDLEDIRLFQPHGVWWFGCGTRNEGSHVSLSLLNQLGFQTGVEARRALLRMVSDRRTTKGNAASVSRQRFGRVLKLG